MAEGKEEEEVREEKKIKKVEDRDVLSRKKLSSPVINKLIY